MVTWSTDIPAPRPGSKSNIDRFGSVIDDVSTTTFRAAVNVTP